MKKQDTYCEKIRNLILLQDSGELMAGQADEINRHIGQCRNCRSYLHDVRTLMTEGRTALPDSVPSRRALEKVLESAAAGRGTVVRFVNPLRYAAAAAAVLALLLGTYIALYTPERTGGGPSGYVVGDVQIMVALASDGSVGTADEEAGRSDEEKLKALADTLLRLQGFKLEESESEPQDITDLLLPTALLLRNTPESPSGTSV